MLDAFIVEAVRTPIGRFGGALQEFSPVDLCAHVMKGVLAKSHIEGKDLDLYVMGNVLKHGHGQFPTRNAAIRAGIPANVDGYGIDMLCSSSMMAMMNAATAVRMGEADLALGGGFESMSQTGFYLSHRARWGYKFLMGQPEQVMDVLLHDGLTDSTNGLGMGEETEKLCVEHKIQREELDEVAFLSHKHASEATEKGLLKKEMVPIEIKVKKAVVLMDRDEGIRPETTHESLAALRPAFKKDGVITAGNSSQISDGAAALLIASKVGLEKRGLKPVAKILGWAAAGVEPWRFVEGPIPAVQKLLKQLNLKIEDIDLFENNEAFGLNNVLFRKALGVPYEKINIFGGAIALGHPIGCSGARIIGTLVNALRESGGKRGIACLCHGVGGGTAFAIEML